MAKRSVAEALKEASKKPVQNLVVSEFLEHLMATWGGPSAFANAFFTEFRKGREGGMVRARMLADVLRLFQVNTAQQKGHVNAVEGLTDEELQAAARELLNGSPT